MFRRVLASATLALSVIVTSLPSPALADFNLPYINPAFFYIPDGCDTGGCHYTNATAIQAAITGYNEVSALKGDMQNLKSGLSPTALRGAGFSDPSGATRLYNIQAVLASAPDTQKWMTLATFLADPSNASVQANQVSMMLDNISGSGGQLQAAQAQGLAATQNAAALNELVQMQAAAQLSEHAQVRQSYVNMSTEFDLNSSPTVGWGV